MLLRLSFAVLTLFSGSARAADRPRLALCQGNPDLDRAVFVVTFTPETAKAVSRTFKLHHCALSGRDKKPPMEVQRYYDDGKGTLLSITTQFGSQVSEVRLLPLRAEPKKEEDPWTADLGRYFNSELLAFTDESYAATLHSLGDASGAGVKGTVKIRPAWND